MAGGFSPRKVAAFTILAFGVAAPVASAALMQQTTNQTGDFTVSSTDLLNGSTPNPTAAVVHEGSSAVYSTLVDGSFGTKTDKTTSVTPNNSDVVVFTLTSTAAAIKQIVTYSGWPDGGRDDQRYVVAYSTAAAPTTFTDIATVNNAVTGNSAANSAQQVVIYDDTGANLATNVAAIRFTFTANQENGYTGYREFDAFSTAFTPEPASLGLLAVGGLGLLARRRRSRG